MPNVIIRSSRLGDNCYKLLEEYLIEHKDKNIHLLLDSYFPYLDSQSFIDIETGMVYDDKEELFLATLDDEKRYAYDEIEYCKRNYITDIQTIFE